MSVLDMRAIDALKLHSGDQVRFKDTGEVVRVLQSYRDPKYPKYVIIEILSRDEGYVEASHLDIF